MTLHQRNFEADTQKLLTEAFIKAVRDALERRSYGEAKRLLETYSIEELIEKFSLSATDLAPLLDAAEDAMFMSAGTYLVPGAPTAVRNLPFDRRQFRAEEAVRAEGARLVKDITDSSRESIRNAIQESLRTGQSPNKIARQLAGTYNPARQVYEGSVIGLSPGQEKWARRAEQELQTLNENYFTRKLRDKRYDATVRRAIREGKPLSTSEIIRITSRYREKLLAYRARTIARTEAHTALNLGRYQKILQTLSEAGLDASAATAVWRSPQDHRVRDTHGALRGDKQPLGQPFVTTSGHRMRYPGDRSLGAPAEEIVNCRCTLTFKVDFS